MRASRRCAGITCSNPSSAIAPPAGRRASSRRTCRTVAGNCGPRPGNGTGRIWRHLEQPVRVSATVLIHFQRNRYSVPTEAAHRVISLHIYPFELMLVAEGQVLARHARCFERYQTRYDWQHYIQVVQRKPGALRDGAPFAQMPAPLRSLQHHLLRRLGGDRVMAQVLAAVPVHGLEAVLVAVELVLELSVPNGEHVLNVLARLNEPVVSIESVASALTLTHEPQANVDRYDALRSTFNAEAGHVY